MSDEKTPKLHADEVDVDEQLVRSLLTDQFPEWAHLPLRRTASTGTDNAIYRLGDRMGVRVPRIHWAVHQIDMEYRWLGRLAPRLPVAVPEPLAKGAPGNDYPYPWLVYGWLEGEDALEAEVVEWNQLARDVAGFVVALEQIDPTDGPPARSRGGPLAPHDKDARRAIRQLDAALVDRAMAIWEEALLAGPWTAPPVWVHGDLYPGNVVVSEGRLRGVIDWSGAGVGDPACDAMFAWSLPPDARAEYLTALEIDDATRARARAWVVEQAAMFIPYYAETIPLGVEAAKRRLDAVLNEP
jgi:aminoglycoside phosphotransferase (APT) family kinase protein